MVERLSEHPMARAIVDGANSRILAAVDVSEFTAVTGRGVTGIVEGRGVLVGQRSFLEANNVQNLIQLDARADEWQRSGKTVMFVSIDGQFAGLLAGSDPVKSSTPEAIQLMHSMGLRIVMLTGDNEKTAQVVATSLGIDEFAAGMRPDEKLLRIQSLKNERPSSGDGGGWNE